MTKKLSICIPTYNRANFLGPLLANIYNQLSQYGLEDCVEVLVSNNASPDNTNEVVAPFLAQGLNYHENEANIGPDANFLQLFEKAVGRYIWLPGDDDLFKNDTIKYIVDQIDSKNFDYLYLRISPGVHREPEALDKSELLRRVSIMTTFMTSQVIRADLVKKHVGHSRSLLGGYMAYFYVFLAALHDSKVCIVSGDQEVTVTPNNTGGYKFYKVWTEAVMDSFLATPFSSDRKLFNRFRRDMLLGLVLPITYMQRAGNSRNKFLGDDPGTPPYKRYYKGSIELALIESYLKGPLWLLRPLNLAVLGFRFILNRVGRRIF